MVQITKQAVQQWVMFEYLAKKHRFQSDISMFERKYNVSLEAFEKNFETADKEVVEEWDDYIDWKAAVGMLPRVLRSIEKIKRGAIEIVE